MKYYEKPNFNPGGIIDRVDSRDYAWEEVGGATQPTFNWDKGHDIELLLTGVLQIPNFKLKVKDQGESFSCGGQAWGYMAEVLEALSTKTYEPRSAKYMYAQTCVPGGGSRGRDNAEVYVKQGVAREDVLSSYQNSQPPSEAFMQRSVDITEAIRVNARLSKASSYAQVGTDIDTIAQATATGSGTVIGVEGENNGTWLSALPKPPTSVKWRHWLYAGKAKKINGKKYIGVLNSWGKELGEDGWQWLSEDYFKRNVFSGWTHVFAPVILPNFNFSFVKNMKFGETSGEVQALQTALKIDGQFPENVPATGYYGDITRKAVLTFQIKYKIISNPDDSNEGRVVGPKTRQVLNSFFSN